MPEQNWARNLTYRAGVIHHPQTREEVQSLVAASAAVRALGSRHSFNDIADSPGELLVLDRMPTEITIDPGTRTVTASAGLKYGELAPVLHDAGWALENLASLPHISIAGTIATGTHGSGVANRSLAAAVAAVELVSADGGIRWIRRGEEEFDGAVVSLGALGVVTRVTLDIVPAFAVRQSVYRGLPWQRALERLDDLLGGAYSVSLFTDWASDEIRQVWHKSVTGDVPTDLLGARPAGEPVHPLSGAPADRTTVQGGVPGPWHERLPHFRLEFTPSSGEELQTEYLLPRRHAAAAIGTMRGLGARIAPALQVSEVRTFAADSLWLSGAEGTDVLAIHFTWRKAPDLVLPLLPEIEAALAPFGARPHWGKLFAASGGALRALYPRFADFAALRDRLDPDRKFDNAFLRRLFD